MTKNFKTQQHHFDELCSDQCLTCAKSLFRFIILYYMLYALIN